MDVLPKTVLAPCEVLRVAEREVDSVDAMIHADGANNGGGPGEPGRVQGDRVRVVHVDDGSDVGGIQCGGCALAHNGEVSRVGAAGGMEDVCAEGSVERSLVLAGGEYLRHCCVCAERELRMVL